MSLLQTIYPFTSLKEFFTFFYLVSESEDDLEFVVDSFNQISNLNINDVHLLLDKFQRLFDLKESSFSSYFLSLKSVVSKKMKILLPPVNKCLQCGKNLEISSNSNEITAFCFDSVRIMKQKSKYCSLCVIDYSFRNYTIGKTAASYLYPQEVLLSFLATSKSTCFEIKLLQYFDEQVTRNGVTFEGFADSYNRINPEKEEIRSLNRIRLSEAWYSYKIKYFLYQNNPNNSILDFKSNSTEIFLEPFLPIWKNNFTSKWSTKHSQICHVINCDISG